MIIALLSTFCLWFYFHMSGDMQDSLTALLTWLSRDFNKVHTNTIKRLARHILGSHRGSGSGCWRRYRSDQFATRHCKEVDGQHHAPVDLLPGKTQ